MTDEATIFFYNLKTVEDFYVPRQRLEMEVGLGHIDFSADPFSFETFGLHGGFLTDQ